ncbi:SDR family oxidoreductase [Desulfosarcina sp. OttesenSCG-928-A07]|nr:SDR family oxidoreductase [Desulfosarcina sp. OttesenSCG-928-G17]MDL2328984.1 SDR family oxidoreductase [Desulfosarcina sp. OttesenSCG-928-A07]
MKISGHIAIVTGGASGLGKATAQALANSGAKVAILDMNPEAGKAAAAEIGNGTRFVPVDVADPAAVTTAVDQIVSEFGTIHIVANCAGIGTSTKILGQNGLVSPEWFTHIVNVNLTGTFNVIRSTIATLSANSPDANGERGVYINTASIAATDGQIGQAAYAASKGGIVSMTLALAREFANSGIRVMAIMPGIFDTPLLSKLNEKAKERLNQQIPFPPRLGHVQEFAELVQHIISNSYLNGEAIRLDGGIRMGFGRK